jgi:hypothetical protein
MPRQHSNSNHLVATTLLPVLETRTSRHQLPTMNKHLLLSLLLSIQQIYQKVSLAFQRFFFVLKSPLSSVGHVVKHQVRAKMFELIEKVDDGKTSKSWADKGITIVKVTKSIAIHRNSSVFLT